MSRICPSCGRRQDDSRHIACHVCNVIYIQDQVDPPKHRRIHIVAILLFLIAVAFAACHFYKASRAASP